MQKRHEIVTLRDEQFGYRAAAESEVEVDVVGEGAKLVVGFLAGEHAHAVAVLTQNVRIVFEVILEVTSGIVTTRGDYRIKIGNSFHEGNAFRKSGFDTDELVGQHG